ncbi:MAG: hypothetical protein AAYR33_07755 [Acetobacteraceae bacterium]
MTRSSDDAPRAGGTIRYGVSSWRPATLTAKAASRAHEPEGGEEIAGMACHSARIVCMAL